MYLTMPNTTIHATVYSRILGLSAPGPIYTCTKLDMEEVRDGAGNFRAEFPASDAMLDQIQIKTTYLKFEVGGKFAFLGLVERMVTTMDREGKQALLVMGRDQLGALAENTIGDLALNYAYNGPAQIIGAASVPNQTFVLSGDGEAFTDTGYTKQFAGESALAALTKLAADLGEHFRAPKANELSVVWLGTNAPDAPVRLVAGGGPRLHQNADVAIIEHIERDHNAERMANRIYPFGAGIGAARLTLASATVTLPAGYTLNAGANYVQFDGTQGLPYVRMAVQKTFNHIGVEQSATLSLTVTADALTGATTINTEFIGIAIPAGTLLDLNGLGTDFVELSASVSAGANVLNVVATTFDVLEDDELIYTPADAQEGAANQLAFAAYQELARIADPSRMVAYKMTVRNLPDTVTVGMTIPVVAQAPSLNIDDDLIILRIKRTVTPHGRAPVVVTVVPVDWFEMSDAAQIATTMEQFRVSQAQAQPVTYAQITDPPTPGTADNFIDLGDVPSSYAGAGSNLVRVTAGADGLAFLPLGNGLAIGSGALVIDLATDPGLEFSSGNLRVKAYHGINRDSNGIGVKLATGMTAMTVDSGGLVIANAIAGDGLIIDTTTKIMAVGAGDGIDVDASSVAVDVTDIIDTNYGLTESSNNIRIAKPTDSGLAFNGSGQLTLGTPTSVSVTSVNSLTGLGVSHSHAVTASSDVGTTPAAALLKSTGAGGVILGTLQVKGNVDITDGGDLTVGANVLFVDVSQDSVGILRAPDPQFALDVNGPIRGTELVGKHAIQLDDLALLLHFDGGPPYETNYTGEINAVPMGRVPSVSTDNFTFRPGKFYKALIMSRARTNRSTNPSFEASLANWNTFSAGSGNLGASRDVTQAYAGSYSAKLTWTTLDTSSFYHSAIASASGDHYSAGVWLKAYAPTTVTLQITRDTSPFTVFGTETVSVTEDWQYFVVETSSAPTAALPLRLSIVPSGAANSLWVDGVIFHQNTSGFGPSWFRDGSMPGCTWSGTEHLSTSSLGLTTLTYPLTDMVPHRWTAMGWFCWPFETPPDNNGAWRINITGSQKVEVFAHSSGIRIGYNGIGGLVANAAFYSGTLVPGQWYHLAVTYTPGALKCYMDGVLLQTHSNTFTEAAYATSVQLGTMVSDQAGELMIDDFCVSRQALTANRVKAIYESDAPVFATSSVFTFRATPKGLVWADEEGFWMRDTDGDAVVGFYGGDAATKSWGGFTLEQGDIVFGRYGASDGGWLWFDRDGVSSNPYLRVGYADKTVFAFDSGGATIDGVLDISTNGGIYQGTGSFASPTTGLKIWNASGVGRIAGYNAGTIQWYAGTDGKLYAGGGNVKMDATGLTVTGDLEAITTTTGSLNVTGSIMVGSAGDIHSENKDTYADTTAGFWLGRDSGAYKLNIGDSSKYLKWTGTDLEIGGGTMAGSITISSTGSIKSASKTGPGDTANAGFWIGYSGSAYQWILGDTSTGYIQNNGTSMGLFIRSAGMNVASAGTTIFNFTTSGGSGTFNLANQEAGFPGDADAKGDRFTFSISVESAGSMHANKFDQDGDTMRVREDRTPASAGAAGLMGEICWDPNYVYVCVATDTWKRAALSTW